MKNRRSSSESLVAIQVLKRSNSEIVDSLSCGGNSVGKNSRQALHSAGSCFGSFLYSGLCSTEHESSTEEASGNLPRRQTRGEFVSHRQSLRHQPRRAGPGQPN